MIRVRDLSFSYPDGRLALDGISFDISNGETVGLIGPNGAGKSTLLLQLNGVLGLPRQHGDIQIGNLTVEPKHLTEIRSHVGLLFQDPDDQLFCPTVGEDVAFGPSQLGLSAVEISKRVQSAMGLMNLTGYEVRIPQHLSLGEKRRVCLAGVLACEPKVLLFDEPTANFDPRGRREFLHLCDSLPGTKLIASHDLEMILELCGRVIVLDHGRVVAEGATEEILGNEELMLKHGLEKPHSLMHHHPHVAWDHDGKH